MSLDRSGLLLMEAEIVELLKKSYGKNLVSILVGGGYGADDFVSGYSDYDVYAFVKNEKNLPAVDFESLSSKYWIEIKCATVAYADLTSRISNNSKSRRFIGNLSLITIKKQSRLLWGKDLAAIIPNIKEIIKRDLGEELRADYYHATNSNPEWNILNREPRYWVNYIISMSKSLLLSKGVVAKKADLPKFLKKYYPDFKGASYLKKAIDLRRTKKALSLSRHEARDLRGDLKSFLEEYKRCVFN